MDSSKNSVSLNFNDEISDGPLPQALNILEQHVMPAVEAGSVNFNDNDDIPDGLLSQVLYMYEQQSMKPTLLVFLFGLEDWFSEDVNMQQLFAQPTSSSDLNNI